MKFYHYILCLLFVASMPVHAQRRKASAKARAISTTELAQQALDSYKFEEAENLLNKEIGALKRKRQPTEHLQAMLETAQRGRAKLHATERIVIIDSLVCNTEDAIRAIKLSHESGRIDTYASTYHTADTNGATLYENELVNKRYLAVLQAPDTTLRLAVTDKLGDNWSEPTLLKGLNADDISQNYPFLLSDGITLYYSATGPESIGGYDIFVSRSDGDESSFLSPENIGFPFNSPANDYLMVIDEYNHLGWFVSDRNQPSGQVCVYTFIPNETREVYGSETDDEQLRSFARISSIRDTWNDEVEAERQRLAAIRNGQSGTHKDGTNDFTFVIDDARIYTRLSDFHSNEARQMMQQWLRLSKTVATDAVMLDRLRSNYASASQAQRTQLAPTIRKMEAAHYPQQQELWDLEKAIRNEEINHR